MRIFGWVLLCALCGVGVIAGEVYPVVLMSAEPATAEPAEVRTVLIEPVAAEPVSDEVNFDFFQVCIWDGLPESSLTVPTYGFKLGIFGCTGAPVYGLEAAVIHAGSDVVDGFKGSLAYTTGDVNGLALAPVNVNGDAGVQIGAVNYADDCFIQFGVLNFMADGFLPVFPLINVKVK